MDDLVAKVYLKDNRTEIADVILCLRGLRFRCRRCASLCCRLGGPALSQRDIDRIKMLGYGAGEFCESARLTKFKLPWRMRGVMKNREEGSCIFLKINRQDGTGECSVYDYRPALCRLYPFYLDTVGPRSLLLRFIPCCRGLDDPDGELVNEEFILKNLHTAIVDLSSAPPE